MTNAKMSTSIFSNGTYNLKFYYTIPAATGHIDINTTSGNITRTISSQEGRIPDWTAVEIQFDEKQEFLVNMNVLTDK